jgi:hypothetical protein
MWGIFLQVHLLSTTGDALKLVGNSFLFWSFYVRSSLWDLRAGYEMQNESTHLDQTNAQGTQIQRSGRFFFLYIIKRLIVLRGWALVMQEQCGLPHCLALLHTISPSLIWRRVSSWYMPGTSQMYSLFLCVAFYEIIKMSFTKTFVSTFKSSLLHLKLFLAK